jgi:hypothetical protein
VSLFDSKLTYGDFSRTGSQDCANAISIDEFDYEGGGTAEQIVDRTWKQWEDDGMEEQWLEQQDDDFEGLDPHKAYEAWASGWRGRAVGYVERELERKLEHGDEDDEDDEDYDEHENPPPKHWWRRPSPGPRMCYRTKADALKVFLDVNSDIVENYGGADYKVSPSEFDAINHKYDLKGKRAARTIADAVWAAMPVGKPYCIDRIDLDALNDTSPAREAGIAFRLPDYVYEAQMAEEEARRIGYGHAEAELPDWVTEHEREPHRVFPPLPSMEGVVPFGARLERREPGVETYQLYQEARPLGPVPSQDVKPVRLQLEEQEPGVATFRINPFAGKLRERRAVKNAIDQYLRDTPPAVHTEDDIVEALIESDISCDDYSFRPSAEMIRSVYRAMIGGHFVDYRNTKNNPAQQYPGRWDTRRKIVEAIGRGEPLTPETATWEQLQEVADLLLSADDIAPYKSARSLVNRAVQGDFDAKKRAVEILNKYLAPEVEGPRGNPAWVTKILAKNYVDLEEEVPPKWLPKITKASASAGKLTATMKEYGCGAYGCVLPTLDPRVVLKLTTDTTEAEFAHGLADKLSRPVVVKYHLTRALPDRYRGRDAFLLWRDSADQVGKLIEAVAERGGDVKAADKAIAKQHKAAQDAFDALHEGRPAQKLLDRWVDAADEMGRAIPELSDLAKNMIAVLRKDKVFFGDVHDGNLGLVNGHWVIVDPGHVAVLQE